MYTVGPRSVRVISRESATPLLLGAAAWFPGPARPPGLDTVDIMGGLCDPGDPATVVCV